VTDADRSLARRLAGPGVVVAAGMAVGQVLGYALAVLGARVLGPARFGELSTLTSLLVIGGVLGLAVQTVSARRVATGEPGSDGSSLVLLGLRASAAVVVVSLVVVPLAAWQLRLGALDAILVAVTLVPSTLAASGVGATQGREDFIALGGLYAILAIGRPGLSVLVLAVTHSVTATMVAAAVGASAAFLVVHRLSRLPWRPAASLPSGMGREGVTTTHALLAMFVLTTVDLLLARHSLAAVDAGAYAAGAIILKIAFWLPQAVAVVVFPRMAEGGRDALMLGAGVVLGLGLLVTLGAAILGPSVLTAALGAEYAPVGHVGWVFGLAGTAEAVAYLLLFSRLAARDRRAAMAVWIAVGTLVVLVLTVGGGSPVHIAWTVTGVVTALCVVGLAEHRRDLRRPVVPA
jgi:O-antigen/teichoic acid export membrane protein